MFIKLFYQATHNINVLSSHLMFYQATHNIMNENKTPNTKPIFSTSMELMGWVINLNVSLWVLECNKMHSKDLGTAVPY